MYTIGQMSKILGISRDKLRYYEDKGILDPNHNQDNNYRKYDYNDILIILSSELYRSLDIDFNTIRNIHEKNEIADIKDILIHKRQEASKEIDRLTATVRRIDQLILGCEDIEKYQYQFTVRSFGPFKILGELSDFTAFDEFGLLHESIEVLSEEPILKSMTRQIVFDDNGPVSSKMLIIKSEQTGYRVEEEQLLYYDKCVYTIIEDSMQQENEMQNIFMKTKQWIRDNGYRDRNMAFLNMILLEPKEDGAKSYLELFVPIE